MAQFEQWFSQDLAENIEIRHCESVMFSGDDKGVVVGVHLFNGGAAYSGGGTVSGKVIRSDGAEVALTGTISGNDVSVELLESCLAVPGPIGVYIRLTADSQKATVLSAVYTVQATSTGTIVDPGTIIQGVNDLIDDIEQAVSSIPADYTALLAAVAPTFSATAQYHEGYYVWYNGELYRYKTNHDAGSWDAAQAVKVPLSKAVGEMQDEARIYQYLTNNGQYTVTAGDMENGAWSYSSKVSNTKRVRIANLIPVRAGMQILYSTPTLRLGFWVLVSKTATGSFAQNIGFQAAGSSGTINITADGYLIVMADSTNNITVSDYDCSVVISTVGKQISYTMQPRPTDNIYDADAMIEAGTYGINSGLTSDHYLNFPDEENVPGVGGQVISIRYSSTSYNYVRQIYSNQISDTIYTRMKTISGFTKWERIDLSDDLLYQKSVLRQFDLNATNAGMTFTANKLNPNEITLNGTWTGSGVCFANIFAYSDNNQILEAGKYYCLYIDTPVKDENLCVELFTRDSLDPEVAVETKIGQFKNSEIVLIPGDAVNYLLRVRYMQQNVAVNSLKITVKIFELNDTSSGVYGNGKKHVIQNKKIALFGDSIMSGSIQSEGGSTHCCSEYIQDELNIEVVDYAYGSVGYITHVYRTKNILELAKMTNLTGCTYFVCSAGDNDYQYPIGNYNDTNSQYDDYAAPDSGATIIGNLYKLVVYLHETYPNMTIIIVDKPNATKSAANSVWPTYRRTDGNWVKQLNTAFKEFCEYYGCAHISLDNMGADPWLLNQLLGADQVHWTRLGYQKLMLYIAGEIRKYTGQGNYYTPFVKPVWKQYESIIRP